MIWKTTNGLNQEVTWYDQQEIEQMDKERKFICQVEWEISLGMNSQNGVIR